MFEKKKFNIPVADSFATIEEEQIDIDDIGDMYSTFMNMRQVYGAALREVNTKLQILDDEFSVKYDHNPIHHIQNRIKKPQSIVNKLVREKKEVTVQSAQENLTDIAGLRVICNYIEDVYTIEQLLLKQDDIKLLERKDYIENPKPSGYRSLHIIVSVPVFLAEETKIVPVEIQIRTIAMDFWASLEHQIRYKKESNFKSELSESLTDCANTVFELDQKMQHIFNRIQDAKE